MLGDNQPAARCCNRPYSASLSGHSTALADAARAYHACLYVHMLTLYMRYILWGPSVCQRASKHAYVRYKDLVDDEDHERLTRVLTALEKKDEMQQRMEAITKSIPFFRQLNT